MRDEDGFFSFSFPPKGNLNSIQSVHVQPLRFSNAYRRPRSSHGGRRRRSAPEDEGAARRHRAPDHRLPGPRRRLLLRLKRRPPRGALHRQPDRCQPRHINLFAPTSTTRLFFFVFFLLLRLRPPIYGLVSIMDQPGPVGLLVCVFIFLLGANIQSTTEAPTTSPHFYQGARFCLTQHPHLLCWVCTKISLSCRSK